MIEYDEGGWGVAFVWRWRGSTIPRASVWGIACAITSLILRYILSEIEHGTTSGVWENDGKSWRDDVTSDILKGFTFAMSFALVTRTSRAYSRYVDGGTLLEQTRGEWFNAFSNLMAFTTKDPSKSFEVDKFQHLAARMFSLLYGNALLQVSTMADNHIEFLKFEGFAKDDIDHLMSSHDSCELVLHWIQKTIAEASDSGVLSIAPPILSRVYNQLGHGIVRLNNTRKIHDFPVPFPLAQLGTFMLMMHWITTVVTCAAILNTTIMTVLASFCAVTPLWALNYMSVELENPFGDDPNDLPLHTMVSGFNASLVSLLNPKSNKSPQYVFYPEEDHMLETQVFDFNGLAVVQRNKLKVKASKNKLCKAPATYPRGAPPSVFREAQGLADPKDEKTPAVHEGDIEILTTEKRIQLVEAHMAALPDFKSEATAQNDRREGQILELGQDMFSSWMPLDLHTHGVGRSGYAKSTSATQQHTGCQSTSIAFTPANLAFKDKAASFPTSYVSALSEGCHNERLHKTCFLNEGLHKMRLY